MILVTGGAGYLGTHTCAALSKVGKPFLILDNFSNSSPSAIDRLEKVCGTRPTYVRGDVRDSKLLTQIFQDYSISAVIHFAASKYVGESVAKPLLYYDNNINGLVTLLQVMQAANVHKLVFSSSSGVYGNPTITPVMEDTAMCPISPYGHTKAIGEQILRDLVHIHPDWKVACLRYFNPIGAHESGLLGEEAFGVPNTLLPYMTRVAAGELSHLNIFGGDYPTIDGTPVRDYLHVMDLAEGHVKALDYLPQHDASMFVLNLGAGKGCSVLEMVSAFERVSHIKIPYEIVPRRFGDAAACWADSSKANAMLGWHTKRDLNQMIEDAWRWQCYCDGLKK